MLLLIPVLAWTDIQIQYTPPGYCAPMHILEICFLTVPAKHAIPHTIGYINHSLSCRSRRAFPMTDTELNVIAALAIIGLSNTPKIGYSSPAAIGTPKTL